MFIVGWPRSGSTLLAKMLSAHPSMICGAETHMFSKTSIFDSGDIEGLDIDEVVESMSRLSLVGQNVLSLYGLTCDDLRVILAACEVTTENVLWSLYSRLLVEHDACRIVEKTPNHILHLNAIRRCFPSSPIIRIVRDARDSCFSMRKLTWMSDDPVEAAILWRQWYIASRDFCATDAKTYTVRYEDLVQSCKVVLQEICEFLGEQFDERMCAYASSVDTVATPGETWKGDVSGALDASRLYSWKHGRLDAEALECVTSLCLEGLREFGYDVPDIPNRDNLKRLIEGYPRSYASHAFRMKYRDLSLSGDEVMIFYGKCNIKSLLLVNAFSLKRCLMSWRRLRRIKPVLVRVDSALAASKL